MSHFRRQQARTEQKRVNIDEEFELRDWTERYGVSADRIREAVRMVGDKATDVVKYLIDGGNHKQYSS